MGRKKIEGVNPDHTTCRTDCMEVHPDNPRKHIDPKALAELEALIALEGVLEPLVVKVKEDNSGVLILRGQRRHLCAQNLGIEVLPIRIYHGNARECALMMGVQGSEPLSFFDLLNWVRHASNAGASDLEISKRQGHTSEAWARKMKKLINLCDDGRAALQAKEITKGMAEQIAALPEDEQATKLAEIRAAVAAGNGKAGSVKPKRPGIKICKSVATRFATEARGLSQGEIDAFLAGVQFSIGELSGAELTERFGIEVDA